MHEERRNEEKSPSWSEYTPFLVPQCTQNTTNLQQRQVVGESGRHDIRIVAGPLGRPCRCVRASIVVEFYEFEWNDVPSVPNQT